MTFKQGDRIRFKVNDDFIYEIYTIIEQRDYEIYCALKLVEVLNSHATWALIGHIYNPGYYSIDLFELAGKRIIKGKNLPHKLTKIFK